MRLIVFKGLNAFTMGLGVVLLLRFVCFLMLLKFWNVFECLTCFWRVRIFLEVFVLGRQTQP